MIAIHRKRLPKSLLPFQVLSDLAKGRAEIIQSHCIGGVSSDQFLIDLQSNIIGPAIECFLGAAREIFSLSLLGHGQLFCMACLAGALDVAEARERCTSNA